MGNNGNYNGAVISFGSGIRDRFNSWGGRSNINGAVINAGCGGTSNSFNNNGGGVVDYGNAAFNTVAGTSGGEVDSGKSVSKSFKNWGRKRKNGAVFNTGPTSNSFNNFGGHSNFNSSGATSDSFNSFGGKSNFQNAVINSGGTINSFNSW